MPQHQAASSPGFPHLRAPLTLACGQALPNRIVFGGHITNFGHGNIFTERHAAYFAARARGGVGMIVLEPMRVHPLDWPYEHIPFANSGKGIQHLVDMAGEIARAGEGTLVLAGLTHFGAQSSGKLLRQSPWGPSPVADVASRRMCRVMERAHIAEVVDAFASAAAEVCAATDGVEIQAGQHSLLRQFLSPLSNHRDDEYGGPPENRLRLLREVMQTVRGAIGPHKVLGLRLCADEMAPWGGLTPADAGALARMLCADTPPDYISAQIGGPYTAHLTHAPMPTPQGEGIAAAVEVAAPLEGRVPVFAEGRLEDPQVAEGALATHGLAGAVMTRALISDPELPAKLAQDPPSPIRPHVGMSRYYSVLGDWNRPLSDLANPMAGREARHRTADSDTISRARAPGAARPVAVIGGGPAGMQAAVTLAGRGHAVHLHERGAHLGGMAQTLATALPERAEFGPLVDYQAQALEAAGVKVKLNSDVAPGAPELADCQAVILAVGARPAGGEEMRAALPGDGSVPVASPRALLSGQVTAPGGGVAMVVDLEGGFRMGNAVEWLCRQGCQVWVLSPDFLVGRELVESGEIPWFQRVAGQGVELLARVQATGIREGALHAMQRFGGATVALPRPDLVVLAQPEVQDVALETAWRAAHPNVHTVGDARAPRLMGEATAHALKVAMGV